MPRSARPGTGSGVASRPSRRTGSRRRRRQSGERERDDHAGQRMPTSARRGSPARSGRRLQAPPTSGCGPARRTKRRSAPSPRSSPSCRRRKPSPPGNPRSRRAGAARRRRCRPIPGKRGQPRRRRRVAIRDEGGDGERRSAAPSRPRGGRRERGEDAGADHRAEADDDGIGDTESPSQCSHMRFAWSRTTSCSTAAVNNSFGTNGAARSTGRSSRLWLEQSTTATAGHRSAISAPRSGRPCPASAHPARRRRD